MITFILGCSAGFIAGCLWVAGPLRPVMRERADITRAVARSKRSR